MTTALDIITGAYGLLGIYGVGSAIASQDAQLGLSVLNDMLDSWSNESLTTFATLDPDIVKLDMNLVRGIEGSAVKRKLVGSVSGLCREMEMLLVAEGVETVAERDVLSELGCDLFQGYLFARPASAFFQPAF